MASVKWKGLKFTLFFGRTNFSVPSFLGRRVQNFNYANDRFPRSFVLGFGNRVRPRKRNKIVDDRHLSSSPRTLVPDLAPDEISSVKCGTVLGTLSLSHDNTGHFFNIWFPVVSFLISFWSCRVSFVYFKPPDFWRKKIKSRQEKYFCSCRLCQRLCCLMGEKEKGL